MYTWLNEKKDISVYTSGQSLQYINRSYGPISNLLSGTNSNSSSILKEKRYWCQTSFVTDKKAIVGWVVKGNTCLAPDLKNATDSEKKLDFFSGLRQGDHVELILTARPNETINLLFEFVSDEEPGYIQGRLPSKSIWSNPTRRITFPEIVSYKTSEQ
jgi:hypothetical protein